MKLRSPSKKVVIFGLLGALLLVIVALVVFYGLSIWPKQTTSDDKDQPAITTSGNVKATAVTPVKVETTKGSVANSEARMLRTHVAIETKEQGDCILILSNEKYTYTMKNSSKGIEHAVGCPQWNLSTDGMAKGDYDLTIEFKGTNDHATVKQKVTL